ncbi:MAG: hypothetical protein AB7F67_21050 [Rhodospirillaceae bacterium]
MTVNRVNSNDKPGTAAVAPSRRGTIARAPRLVALWLALTVPAFLLSGCGVVAELVFPEYFAKIERPKPPKLGTLSIAQVTTPQLAVAEVDDSVLAGKRGAFNGISFNVLFNGTFDHNNVATGNLNVNTNANTGATTAPAPNYSVGNNGDVQIQTVIGNFQGASGIFQIAQVPGNFNVVNNNLFVQVNILQDASSLPSLPSLLNAAKF